MRRDLQLATRNSRPGLEILEPHGDGGNEMMIGSFLRVMRSR